MDNNIQPSRSIKIWFSDMWSGFDFENNYFTIYLKRHFNIELNPKPDFLIHSVYSKDFLKYNCYKICITGENTRPDFERSEFHIGFDFYPSPNYLRWPLFLMNQYGPEYLIGQKDVDSIFKEKKRFCSFVVSNGYARERVEFFEKLSKYKQVDSGGRYLNNIGSPVNDKIAFLSESKFNIAFENTSSPGYVTEKIFDAFLSHSIPIYWGSPRVAEDFNEKAFINVLKFKSFDEAIEYIKFLDQDEDAYKSVLNESCFTNDLLPAQFHIDRFLEFFEFVFNHAGKKKKVFNVSHKFEYMTYIINRKLYSYRKKLKQ